MFAVLFRTKKKSRSLHDLRSKATSGYAHIATNHHHVNIMSNCVTITLRVHCVCTAHVYTCGANVCVLCRQAEAAPSPVKKAKSLKETSIASALRFAQICTPSHFSSVTAY